MTASGAGLVLSLPGQAEIALVGVAEGRFETKDGDTRLDFGGRGGLVEWASLNRSGEVTSLSVITADPKPLKAATRPVEAQAFRDAPRPWPSFRGDRASGNGDGQGAPLDWSVAAGRNLRFKTALPGIALSSPIVWGDRIFVTAAVSGSGDKTFRTGLYGDGTSVDDDLRALVPALRPRREDGRDRLGSRGLPRAPTGEAPPEVEPVQRHPRHRRQARGRALRQRGPARGLRLRGQAALETRHRHPRLQRSPVGDGRMGPRELARPLRRPRASSRGTAARTRSSPPIAPSDRRGGVAGGARRALDLGHPERAARGRRATSS